MARSLTIAAGGANPDCQVTPAAKLTYTQILRLSEQNLFSATLMLLQGRWGTSAPFEPTQGEETTNMNNNSLLKKCLTPQNLIRLILLVLGFTIFPAVAYWVGQLLFPSGQNLSEFYAITIYGSLMDWGIDGMFAWGVICIPYLVYDVFLLIKDFKGAGGFQND